MFKDWLAETVHEDDGTGLYYYRARYYSPVMGRFISEDPIRFAGNMADGGENIISMSEAK